MIRDYYKTKLETSNFQISKTPQDMNMKDGIISFYLLISKHLVHLGLDPTIKTNIPLFKCQIPMLHKQMGGPIFPTSMKFSAVKDRIFIVHGQTIGSKGN